MTTLRNVGVGRGRRVHTHETYPALGAALCAALLFTPLVRAQTDLYVGSNTPSNTLDLTNGTNAYANTYVGFTVDASNNALGVYNAGTLLTNTSELFVGRQGSGNTMTVADGAVVAAVTSYMGSFAVSSNNSVLVTGTNSMWQNSSALHVGYSGNGNRLVISNGGAALNAIGYIGFFGSDNIVEVTGAGSLWTNSGDLQLGVEDNANGNQLVVSNGGTVAANRLWVGYWESLSNSLVVTGTNSLLQHPTSSSEEPVRATNWSSATAAPSPAPNTASWASSFLPPTTWPWSPVPARSGPTPSTSSSAAKAAATA